jgi:hypothetical protein
MHARQRTPIASPSFDQPGLSSIDTNGRDESKIAHDHPTEGELSSVKPRQRRA